MTVESGAWRRSRIANRTGARLYGAAGCCLLACLAGLAGGCAGGGDGTLAPVESLGESVVPGGKREHVVAKGDTVYSIAWRHGVDYRALARANAIRDPFTIYPGQRMLIPEPDAPGDAPPPAADPQPKREPKPPPVPKASAKPSPEAAGVARETPPKAPAQRRQSDKAPPKAAAQRPPPAPKQPVSRQPKQVDRQLAAATVAGVRWTWPAKGRTVGGFARGGGKGIDVAGAFEQPIRAAARGQVVYAGSGLIGYGKLIIVKHNNRLLSAYAHNERLHVKEGEAVKGGQHIADMGRSSKGRAMLHFEIRRDGKAVDPLRFLPR